MRTLLQPVSALLRHSTGVVIPVYFPEKIPLECALPLVQDTVIAFSGQVAEPANICVAMDGNIRGVEAMTELCRSTGASLCVLPVNRGKLNAARGGAKLLLENRDLKFLAIVDQDGDHFPYELGNFVRSAAHVCQSSGTERVMVLGQRTNLHRPMGYLRGELEDFVDRVLLDALHYHAAVTGVPLRLEYACMLRDVPDFHSGYKLFSRTVAENVFLREPQLAGVSEPCYYRHGVEAVMTVEAFLSGALLSVVNRSTFNEQPISTFGLMNRSQLFADMITWPCKRLQVPPHFVLQWLTNHAPRLLLNTLIPQGPEEILRIVELVLKEFPGSGPSPDILGRQPLFV